MENHTNRSLPVIGSIAVTALLVGGFVLYMTSARIDVLQAQLTAISVSSQQNKNAHPESDMLDKSLQQVTIGAISFGIPKTWIVKGDTRSITIKPDDGVGSVGGNEIVVSVSENPNNGSLKDWVGLGSKVDGLVFHMGENRMEYSAEGLYQVKTEVYRLLNAKQFITVELNLLPQNPQASEEMTAVYDGIREVIKSMK